MLKKCGKKSDSSLKIGKNFTKDFPVKKKNPCKFFVKLTQIKIKGNFLVKFTVGGPRSIHKEILDQFIKEFLCKIEEKKFYKASPCKKIKTLLSCDLG